MNIEKKKRYIVKDNISNNILIYLGNIKYNKTIYVDKKIKQNVY